MELADHFYGKYIQGKPRLDKELITIILCYIDILDYKQVRLVSRDINNILMMNHYFKKNWMHLMLFNICESYNKDVGRRISNNGYNKWDHMIYYAALHNHKGLIDLLLKKGASNLDYGMQGASRGGHSMLVKWFIQKGADYWQGGLMHAENGGHQDLIDLFKNKIKIDLK